MTNTNFNSGQIVCAVPGLAIMHLSGEQYLVGEKVVTIPKFRQIVNKLGVLLPRTQENFIDGLLLALEAGHNKNTLDRIRLNKTSGKGFAVGMALLNSEDRMAAWNCLQKNVNNLFKVHSHIEKLIVATHISLSDEDYSYAKVEKPQVEANRLLEQVELWFSKHKTLG